MWGRLQPEEFAILAHRNTPTHVGKTSERVQLEALNRKHPHACGEDMSYKKRSRAVRETPPRMWGRQPVKASLSVITGNTPTHVGKTPSLSSVMRFSQKHPHACGEDGIDLPGKEAGVETPPRMWGRHFNGAAS